MKGLIKNELITNVKEGIIALKNDDVDAQTLWHETAACSKNQKVK